MTDDEEQLRSEAFRSEVRAFLDREVTPDLRQARRVVLMLDIEAQQRWHRILYRQGWLVPGWPVAHGGTGWSPRQRHIFSEELARAEAPPLSPFLNMIGPVLYTFGTDAQRERHLPPLLAGDVVWCQGYSEPGAGSDLASLRTRATRDGDDYIVNGQKIWTSYAHESDWIFCLVRTSSEGKPQAGISFLMIDLRSPGVDVRPIRTIDGLHHLNEVFFTDVRVPAENLVGSENSGWHYAKFLLQHERQVTGASGGLRTQFQKLEAQASAAPGDGGLSMRERPDVRLAIAMAEVDLIALACFERRALDQLERGEPSAMTPSIMKLRASEVQQQLSRLAMQVAGPHAAVRQADMLGQQDHADRLGPKGTPEATASYLFGRSATILAGTSEVQRNIIYASVARELS